MSLLKKIRADTVYLLTSAKTPLDQVYKDIEILRGKGFSVQYFEDGFDDRVSYNIRSKRFTLRAAARELERIAMGADIVYVALDDSSPFLSTIRYGCRAFNLPITNLYEPGGKN